ncbi:uncharacterized protein PFL1_01435 [Pseudozyma flocculosa PF-1]|uniref:Nuclear pore complex protein Nup85 n=1 Tax=Pseudozyma flocculosa TaxID=84751 RepID=A0A5C3EW14_9BASI|nr:uncharacterized protein PFL1_01435 [Pseudozyma flocculosa PF-1]EPQ31250.1 hypothetical protein PFL1_01435 [Pseudozyma flocculosa PF-1]SPO36252.1 uncharacterized protein PSFLO_01723 [Pseudozyma flocculosa]
MVQPTSTSKKLSYAWDTTPEQKQFFTQSYTIFTSAQKIEQDVAATVVPPWQAGNSAASLMPFQQTMQYYHRISGLYRSAVRDYLSQLENAPEPDLDLLQKWQAIHTALHLAEILYFPADGRGAGVVGEELLHWLNSFDFAPTTEEGQEIAQAAVPYSHPNYWDYVLRCVLRGFHTSAASVLKSLVDQHPAAAVRRVAEKAAHLLSTLPRSIAYGMEHEFIAAHRSWIGRVRNVLSGLEQEMDDMEAQAGHSEESEEERLEYEAQFRCLLELMAGVKDRVFEACEDWREALGAWGHLVQPTLKRDDVPGMVDALFEQFPIDGTLAAEAVQAHLVKGEVARAVSKATEADIWLAAHLADLADKAGLLEEDAAAEMGDASDQDLRIKMLLRYADEMLEEQGLWRISIDYLGVCGAAGRRKMREVILSVPYFAPSKSRAKASNDEDGEDESDDDEAMEEESEGGPEDKGKGKDQESGSFERAEEILRACAEHGMEEEARVICKRLARAMTQERRYGVAVAYCVRAGDATQIRQISDQLLDEYVERGAETFMALVDSIPQSLLAPVGEFGGAADDEGLSARGLFSTRLAFLARYRDFHRLYAEANLRAAAQLLAELITSEAAPEAFLAVLLVDAIPLLEADEQLFDMRETFELMRIVEQVTGSVRAHPRLSEHYLGYLNKLMGGAGGAVAKRPAGDNGPASKSAGDKLDVVRLGLARHLARVSVAQMGVVY